MNFLTYRMRTSRESSYFLVPRPARVPLPRACELPTRQRTVTCPTSRSLPTSSVLAPHPSLLAPELFHGDFLPARSRGLPWRFPPCSLPSSSLAISSLARSRAPPFYSMRFLELRRRWRLISVLVSDAPSTNLFSTGASQIVDVCGTVSSMLSGHCSYLFYLDLQICFFRWSSHNFGVLLREILEVDGSAIIFSRIVCLR
jgi:hypothetical protein